MGLGPFIKKGWLSYDVGPEIEISMMDSNTDQFSNTVKKQSWRHLENLG